MKAKIVLLCLSSLFSSSLICMEPQTALRREMVSLRNTLETLENTLQKTEQPKVSTGLPAEIQLDIIKKFIPPHFKDDRDIIKTIIKAVNFAATQSESQGELNQIFFDIAKLIKTANPKEIDLARAFSRAINAEAKNVLTVLLLVDQGLLKKSSFGDRTLLMINSQLMTDIPVRIKDQQRRLKMLLEILDILKDNIQDLNAIVNAHAGDDYYENRGATALILAIASENYYAAELLLKKAFEWGILQETLEATNRNMENAYRTAQNLKDPHLAELIKEYYAKIGRHYY